MGFNSGFKGLMCSEVIDRALRMGTSGRLVNVVMDLQVS